MLHLRAKKTTDSGKLIVHTRARIRQKIMCHRQYVACHKHSRGNILCCQQYPDQNQVSNPAATTPPPGRKSQNTAKAKSMDVGVDRLSCSKNRLGVSAWLRSSGMLDKQSFRGGTRCAQVPEHERHTCLHDNSTKEFQRKLLSIIPDVGLQIFPFPLWPLPE